MTIPRKTEMTKRLLRVFHAATPEQVVAGVQWYDRHARDIADIADAVGFNRNLVAEVTAALSPRIQWSRNLKLAEETCRAFAAGKPPSTVRGVFRANVSKAYDILRGDIGALGGDKTVSFALNLMGDTDAVTVDVWAMRAAMGYDKASLTSKQYRQIADSYRSAANRVGLSPRDFQAVVWCAERGRAT